ncbi:hypothetical protein [Fortiea sp. LEGE XX443]|nr:hypothetical protein [Fortiea sp. LEGE XX443]
MCYAIANTPYVYHGAIADLVTHHFYVKKTHAECDRYFIIYD